jgi:hypothetical protein
MTPEDFRRIANGLPGAEASFHMGAADFRVGGSIFATLAHEKQGYGNLMLTPEAQADLLADRPDLFLPVKDGWGRHGATHIRLAEADEPTLTRALEVAWKLRIEKSARSKKGSAKALQEAFVREVVSDPPSGRALEVQPKSPKRRSMQH